MCVTTLHRASSRRLACVSRGCVLIIDAKLNRASSRVLACVSGNPGAILGHIGAILGHLGDSWDQDAVQEQKY